MNMLAFAINAAEKAPLSDALTLTGINFLCNRTKRRLEKVPFDEELNFARDMATFPVATHTDEANRQHYEVPAEFLRWYWVRNENTHPASTQAQPPHLPMPRPPLWLKR